MRSRLIPIFLIVLATCTSAQAPVGNGPHTSAPVPTPSPTRVYDPSAPRGGGTYQSKGRKVTFRFPPPWHRVDEPGTDTAHFENFTLTSAEIQRREANDVYGNAAGEGFFDFSMGPRRRTIAQIMGQECRVHDTNIKRRECRSISVGGFPAAWILMDYSDDSDCTCRSMYVLVGPIEYEFSGGGCIIDYCHQTTDILAQLDRIFRGAVIRG
jgi:hypothetical protein